METMDQIANEVSKFDRATTSLTEISRFVQERLDAHSQNPSDEKNRIPNVYVFRKAFGLSIHDAMKIVVGWGDSNLTVEEVLTEIRKMDRAANL